MERIIIQSDTTNLIQVEQFVNSLCDTYNINNYAGTISMSLIQAVTNAIVHGNRNDATKTVTIVSDFCRGGVYFSVSHQGDGFDPTSIAADDLSDEGKGLFIMRRLSDKLVFSDEGRTVRMEFFVKGIDSSRSIERVVALRKYYAQSKTFA